MRMMLRVSMDTPTANEALQNGALQKIIEEFTSRHKPEAAYFFADGGERAALFVFDLKNTSDLVGIAEPLFHGLNAQVDMIPVMNASELGKGVKGWLGSR